MLKSGEIYVAPVATTIATKYYPEGFLLSTAWQVFNIEGQSEVSIDAKELAIKGSGWIKAIETSVIKVTGAGPDKQKGTADDGITLQLDISPYKQDVFGSAQVEIPPLNLNADAQLTSTYTHFNLKTVFKIANAFSSATTIMINPFNKEAFEATFDFQQDFSDYLKKEMPSIIEQLRSKAQSDISQYDQKLREFQQQLDNARRDESEINRINREIKRLDSKCSWNNPTPCAQATALRGSAVLKKSISGIQGIISQATKEIRNFQGLKTVAQRTVDVVAKVSTAITQATTIIVVKKASGEIKGLDLKAGKLPKINEMVLEISIPGKATKTITMRGLQFDFKNPRASIVPIANNVFENIEALF
jgi:hypothetical protein